MRRFRNFLARALTKVAKKLNSSLIIVDMYPMVKAFQSLPEPLQGKAFQSLPEPLQGILKAMGDTEVQE